MKAEVVHCQGCGAVLPFDGTKWTITCEYCGMKNVVTLDKTTHERMQKIQQAQRLMEQEKFEEAETCYMDIIDEYPEDGDAWFGLLRAYTWGFSKQCYNYETEYDCEIINRFVYNMTLYNKGDNVRLNEALAYVNKLKEVARKELDYRESIGNLSVRSTEPGPMAMLPDRLDDIEYYCSESALHIENARE